MRHCQVYRQTNKVIDNEWMQESIKLLSEIKGCINDKQQSD
jgi:hypothetical protein